MKTESGSGKGCTTNSLWLPWLLVVNRGSEDGGLTKKKKNKIKKEVKLEGKTGGRKRSWILNFEEKLEEEGDVGVVKGGEIGGVR